MQYSDFRSPSFRSDPYATYQKLRCSGALVELVPRGFITGRYSVAAEILNDSCRFGSVGESDERRNDDLVSEPPVSRLIRQVLRGSDPERQVRLRRLLMKAFDARLIEKFRQTSFDIANRLADDLIQAGQGDLMANVAIRLPAETICSILDVPQQDTSDFIDAVHQTKGASTVYPVTRRQLDVANHATLGLQRYLTALLEFRRRHRGTDLISEMIAAEHDGQHMTNDEIVANVLMLLVVGQEATADMIGNALIALHRHPDKLRAARSDLSILPQVVRECIRYDSSVQIVSRVALRDVKIEKVYVARGSTIEVCIGAANRDPEKFTDPEILRFDRAAEDGPSLSFGAGLHSCLGAHLVSTGVEAALAVLFSRFPNMRITDLEQLRWRDWNALRGVESLQATWI